MKYNFKFSTIIFLLIIASCTSEEFEFNSEPLNVAVLMSIGKEGEPANISLSKSFSLQQAHSIIKGTDIIRNAQIFIQEDGFIVDTLKFTPRSNDYRGDYNFQANHSYSVVANIPKENSLSASVYLHKSAQTEIYSIDRVNKNEILNLKFSDLQSPYLDLRIRRLKDNSNNSLGLFIDSLNINFIRIDQSILISREDIIANSNDIKIYYTTDFIGDQIDSTIVRTLSIDENIYNFMYLNQYNDSDNSIVGSFEKSFTNINGGFGIFAVYSSSESSFEVVR